MSTLDANRLRILSTSNPHCHGNSSAVSSLMPSPLSFRLVRAEAGSQYSFRYFCLICANFYLTAHLTTAARSVFRLSLLSLLYMTFFFCQIMSFIVSCSYLNSWHYFKVQWMSNRTATPVTLTNCYPALPEARRRPCGAVVHIYEHATILSDQEKHAASRS